MNEDILASIEPSRRQWLRQTALGFGSLALSGMCAEQATADALTPKPPHFTPPAKRVIFLFMQGGQSHMDLYDPKPELNRLDGQPTPGKKKDKYKGSPFQFNEHGQSGLQLSELLPHLAKHVDDLCLIRSMHTDSSNHSNAMIFFHTGSQTFVRPSIGSWVLYGHRSARGSFTAWVPKTIRCPGSSPSVPHAMTARGSIPTRSCPRCIRPRRWDTMASPPRKPPSAT